MKKILEKVTSIALSVVSLLFIALVWVVMLKPEISADFNTSLVKAFVIILSSAFLILSGLAIYSSFVDDERLSDVLLFKDRESATKATVAVVKKTAKRVTKEMEEAKIRKVSLNSDESGNISMNVEIKVKTDKTMDVITNVRALLIETFNEIFGIEFSAINFRVITSKSKFVPNDADIKEKVAALKAGITANKPAEGHVQTSKVSGVVEPEENKEEKDELKETAEEITAEENAAEDAAIEEKAAQAEEAKSVEEEKETEEKETREERKVRKEEEKEAKEEAKEEEKKLEEEEKNQEPSEDK